MEEYWLKKAEKDYENEPTLDNWDTVVQELAACEQVHLWAIEDAQEHLERLARLVPDMLHKAKNRETYNRRTR